MIETLQNIIAQAVESTYGITIVPQISLPEAEYGDFSTNVAFQLAAQLKTAPKQAADGLVNAITAPQIAEVTVAGGGFINIRVTDDALWQRLDAPIKQTLAGQTVVAEYSDPNPFKVLHAGHLYTTIVGDVIARLLEAGGAHVHRLNYGGDVGRHVAMSMWAIVKHLEGENPEKLIEVDAKERLEWLSERYVEGNEAFETDTEAKSAITDFNKKVYEIHATNDHESKFAQIYWTCRAWSYDGFDILYKQLEIDGFEKYIPESEVTPKGLELVEKGLYEGVFKKSDGAVIFSGEQHGLHTRVFINSNGLPTYEAKDLGLAALKWQEYTFDLSVIITANDIIEYMKVVLAALSNFYPEVVTRSQHLTHGVIKLPGGVKMSSRKGNILRATDILDAAKQASQGVIGSISDETVLAAVKYAFLKSRIGGDIVYDPEESVNILGNSGPYLQYAHARARSILAKSKSPTHDLSEEILEPAERMLLSKIGAYQIVVEGSIAELMPHGICGYLYELAQVFNAFYESNRVIGDPREELRLKLVSAYADTLAKGLALLGIAAPARV